MKVFVPTLLARMKQGDDTVRPPGFRVCGHNVGPLLEVTAGGHTGTDYSPHLTPGAARAAVSALASAPLYSGGNMRGPILLSLELEQTEQIIEAHDLFILGLLFL